MTQDKQIRPLEERIDFRQRWLAGLLAWLIPGAGHLYQRRYFKGVVYMACIVGIFVWGSSLGEAKAVHLRWDGPDRDAKTRHLPLGYLAQVGVGGGGSQKNYEQYQKKHGKNITQGIYTIG